MKSIFEKLGFFFDGDKELPEVMLEFNTMCLTEENIKAINTLIVRIDDLLHNSDNSFLDSEFISTVIEIDESGEVVEITTIKQYLEITKSSLNTILEHGYFDYPDLKDINRGEPLIYNLLESPTNAVNRLYIKQKLQGDQTDS